MESKWSDQASTKGEYKTCPFWGRAGGLGGLHLLCAFKLLKESVPCLPNLLQVGWAPLDK